MTLRESLGMICCHAVITLAAVVAAWHGQWLLAVWFLAMTAALFWLHLIVDGLDRRIAPLYRPPGDRYWSGKP